MPRTAAAFLAAALLAAPARADALPEELASRVAAILTRHCLPCHGGERPTRGPDFRFRPGLLARGRVVPGRPADSLLLRRLDDADDPMPPDGRLSDDDRRAFREWIAAGAPDLDALPVASEKGTTGSEAVLVAVRRDLDAAPPADGPFYRYLSLNHLLAEGASAGELRDHRDALSLAINQLSRGPTLVRPRPVDRAGTVFRIDLRDLGWDGRPYLREDGRPAEVDRYDLVLFEYPYAIATDSPDAAAIARVYGKRFASAVPVVRGDWFVVAGLTAPLYDDLLALPRTRHGLERALGVKPFPEGAVRGGMLRSAVGKHGRVVERRPATEGRFLWLAYDFLAGDPKDNVLDEPAGTAFDVSSATFPLANGLFAHAAFAGAGGRLPWLPVAAVTDPAASDGVVRPGLSCIRCHDGTLRPVGDDVRPALEAEGDPARKKALMLYPGGEALARLARDDAATSARALRELLPGSVGPAEVLTRVARRYSAGVSARRAAAELGRSRERLDGPADGPGVKTRSAWLAGFAAAAREAGIGRPLPPLDARSVPTLTTVANPAAGPPVRVTLSDTRVRKGDRFYLTVHNDTDAPVAAELAVMTDDDGGLRLLTKKPVEVPAGGSVRFPDGERTFPVTADGPGRLTFVVTAGASAGPGLLLRVPEADRERGDAPDDRLIHPGLFGRTGPAHRLYKHTATLAVE